jgi:hypothetical protein
VNSTSDTPHVCMLDIMSAMYGIGGSIILAPQYISVSVAGLINVKSDRQFKV